MVLRPSIIAPTATSACCLATEPTSSAPSLRMRSSVSWALRRQHHGGVRSHRAVLLEESRGPGFSGHSRSYRHWQVQAGDRDRETAPGGDYQRRLHAGRKTVDTRRDSPWHGCSAAVTAAQPHDKTSGLTFKPCITSVTDCVFTLSLSFCLSACLHENMTHHSCPPGHLQHGLSQCTGHA